MATGGEPSVRTGCIGDDEYRGLLESNPPTQLQTGPFLEMPDIPRSTSEANLQAKLGEMEEERRRLLEHSRSLEKMLGQARRARSGNMSRAESHPDDCREHTRNLEGATRRYLQEIRDLKATSRGLREANDSSTRELVAARAEIQALRAQLANQEAQQGQLTATVRDQQDRLKKVSQHYCNAVAHTNLDGDVWEPLLARLYRCNAIAAHPLSQNNILSYTTWSIQEPWVKCRINGRRPFWSSAMPRVMLIALFGIAKSGNVGSSMYFSYIEALTRSLAMAHPAPIGSVVDVVHAVTEACAAMDPKHVAAMTSWMALLQLEDVIDTLWPGVVGRKARSNQLQSWSAECSSAIAELAWLVYAGQAPYSKSLFSRDQNHGILRQANSDHFLLFDLSKQRLWAVDGALCVPHHDLLQLEVQSPAAEGTMGNRSMVFQLNNWPQFESWMQRCGISKMQ
ncbi:hypothetical protein QBC35DRAFT_235430 [Podospora australis]|uniref:Uncharacterized protein n=1 Tax=Podospora australis TaxID=1536484 RepID=A0AAN6WSI3_9PEZI|nr:hypothetical protein QBC35DRAFT_235430 [Podospora australis]